jgi:hypothetical protein
MDYTSEERGLFNGIIMKHHNYKISFKQFVKELNFCMDEYYIDYYIEKLFLNIKTKNILIDEELYIKKKKNSNGLREFIMLLNQHNIDYELLSYNQYVNFAHKESMQIPFKMNNIEKKDFMIMTRNNYIKTLLLCSSSNQNKYVKLVFMYNQYINL